MYFIIKNNLEDTIAGREYPQTDCLTMAQAHLITSWRMFDPKPRLKFSLKKKSICTNVLSDATIGATGFLMDKLALNIFLSFKIMRHQVFEAPVENNGTIMEYYWLHLSEPDLTKKLDYDRSVFYRTEYTFREEPVRLRSYEHYELLKKEDKEASFGVEIDQVSLSDEFDKTLDVFAFLPFDRNVYISARLKKALNDKGITGLDIKEAANFI